MVKKNKSLGRMAFDVLSSFWLCCVCLLALFVLTIYGTIHQVDHGLYDAKDVYFHSYFLKWNGIPIFPGGLLCMSVLCINLVLGGFVRIKWASRNVGVLIVHVGILVLLISGMVKIQNSDEGHLQIIETLSKDYFQSSLDWEVAIWEVHDVDDAQEFVIQDASFTDLEVGASRTFTSDSLPFELTLSGFLKNCQVLPVGPNWQVSGNPVEGYGFLRRPDEKESEFNIGGLNASIKTSDGTIQEALLWGNQRHPWAIAVDGRTFAIDMRPERYPMPYSIRLDDFIKEEHPGIGMAKAYRSKVTQIDAQGNERPHLIQMNEPLRDGGLVLFQSSYGTTPGGHEYSVFSVVRNPSDKWPEYSMWVITFGMLLTFGRRLISFIRTQSKRRHMAAGAAQ
ncbi:MAG: cytochrome c biogenesis protein ResB [Planctomycetota bacterium]|jgi:hypothetical protein|nr:cytochrome c biogenesis protein ResB [Planctomycetota bacterium]